MFDSEKKKNIIPPEFHQNSWSLEKIWVYYLSNKNISSLYLVLINFSCSVMPLVGGQGGQGGL